MNDAWTRLRGDEEQSDSMSDYDDDELENRNYRGIMRFKGTEYEYIEYIPLFSVEDTEYDDAKQLLREGIEANPGPNGRGGKKRNGRKQQQRRRPVPTAIQDNPTYGLIRRPLIMPANKRGTLTYVDAASVRNNPGASFLVYAMRLNDLFDPDPLILSGSVSNFAETMAFYANYRVWDLSFEWTVTNREAFALNVGCVLSQVNLTASIGNAAACQNAFENDFVTSIQTVAPKGGMDRVNFTVDKFQIYQLLGNKRQYLSEAAYSGVGLASPTSLLFANFICYAPDASLLGLGYTNNIRMQFASEFYGRINVRA